VDILIKLVQTTRKSIKYVDGPAYQYYEDGRDLFLRFIGTRLDTPQMTIAPFIGNPLVGVNVTVNSTTVR
jgi:hypothetical protein